ncbi:MAG: T9SS type A sorting domain-containing protein [Muribaculaceae bacterium]|nr:T9SS type A sorting domain-containing protein [Muribaculaceae bacterium]
MSTKQLIRFACHKITAFLLLSIVATGASFAKHTITHYNNGEKQTIEIDSYQTSIADFNKYHKELFSKKPKVVGQGEWKTFIVQMEYDMAQNIIPISVHAGPSDYGLYWEYEGDDSFEIQIPEEITIIECTFGKLDEQGNLTSLFYIYKDIDNLKDYSTIIFNYADATNKINFVPLKEDGTVLKPSIEDRDNDIIIEANDCLYGFGEYIIWHKDYGMLSENVYFLAHTIDGGEHHILDCPDIYINDVNENYGISASMNFQYNDESFYTTIKYPTWTFNPQTKEIVLSNDPANYRIYDQSFVRNKYATNNNSQVIRGNWYFEAIGYNIVTGLGFEDDDPVEHNAGEPINVKQRICAKPATHIGNDIFDLYFTDRYQAFWIDENGNPNQHVEASSLPWISGESGREYKPFIFPEAQESMFMSQPLTFLRDNNVDDWLMILYADSLYTENLVFTDAQQTDKLNNSCPILTGIFDYYYYNREEYVGRYNEYNEMALYTQEFSPAWVGNDLVMNYTNTGFLVDNNIDAKNIVEIVMKNYTIDVIPPTLRTLTFKNSDGKITDRFTKSEDGIIEFYAADFYRNNDWTYFHITDIPIYEIQPDVTAIVEYAPYGTDDYAPIDVSEDTDKYFEFGCGQFFSGSLGNVTATSSNDWFDLRITLTDADGNTQKQTISPAFKINSQQSHVQDINKSTVNIRVIDEQLIVENADTINGAIYNLTGQIVKNINSAKTNVSELSNGVYIINVNGIARKIALK